MTVQHRAVGTEDEPPAKAASSAALSTKLTPTEAAPGRSGDSDDASPEPSERAGNDQTRAIDATLARFSAVHDQIAAEEDARRKKYSWLLGKRKEPELGRDMPFDFREGNDSQASRLEWKKELRRRRTITLLKALAVAAALTIFVATGISWSAKAWVDAKFQEIAALDPESDAIQDISQQTGDRNFLLIGSDTRAGAQASDGVGDTKDEPGARSDTTMIAHVPADRSRVLVVSFPRDLEVDIPACEKWDSVSGRYLGEKISPRKDVKLNEAYAVGGPKCTTKVIQQLSGLSITNFLGIDFSGFRSMVDSVNGVEICTNTPIIDSSLGTILPKAGHQTVNGTQALHYVRARHVQGDPTSDYGRMQRQQLFLSALLRKAMSTQVLLDPDKLGRFVDSVAANTFGENVGTDQLLHLGQSLQGLDASGVTFMTVPTVGEANEAGNEVLREADTDALFRAIIEGDAVSPPDANTSQQASGVRGGQGGAGPVRAQALDPAAVPVQVVNTTDESGLAGRTADRLRQVGYAVNGVEQLDAPAERTVIRHVAGHAKTAQLLAESLGGAELVEDPTIGDVLRVELGADFQGAVHAPSQGVPTDLSTVNAGKDLCG